MLASDREILRELAKKQMEIANSQKNLDIVSQWYRHSARKPGRPMVHIEIDTFKEEAIEPKMRCISPQARELEYKLLHSFSNQELFGDDKPVPPYFQIEWKSWFNLFGFEIGRTYAEGESGKSVGHHFNHVISDLEDDYEKLGKSTFGVDEAATKEALSLAEDCFGDILPVKMGMGCLYAVPTQQIVHMMGMENMYISMIDYPELFSEMMNRIADDYIAWFDSIEQGGYLLPTAGFEHLGQGSFCFTDELPAAPPVTQKDVWGFMDSQESVSISPDMYGEFIFPCYKKVSSKYGLFSYGCCEPVHPVWKYLETLDNLRKVSISPWCDEEFMGEQLRGSKIIYHRKPSPNFLGVEPILDENAVREHISKTMKAAQGCTLEITQRDVYTVHNNIDKVRRYVEIIRECAEEHWKP